VYSFRHVSLKVGAICAASLFSEAGSAQAEKVTIIFSTPPAPYLLSYYVAEAKGFFKEAGLVTEYKTVGGDQNALRGLVTGAGDVTVISAPVIYEAIINGGKIQIIGGGSQVLTDYFLVMGKDKGTSLKDAAGKTLAISNPGSLPQLVPEMMFRKEGINSAGTRYLSVGGFSARLQAVAGGKVDGTLLDTITALLGEESGVTKIVADAQEKLKDPLAYTFAIGSTEAINDAVRRKALVAFVKASMLGARYAVDHPDEAAEILRLQLKGDYSVDLLKRTVLKLNEEKVWALNGGTSQQLHDATMNTFLQYKLVSKEVSYKEAFNPSLVEEAKKDLGTKSGWQ
jgi:ABC-type nitrate/sulfonate/bicarbonate transport system substrate-binding protein